jgi:methylmalonyl-CoA mutase
MLNNLHQSNQDKVNQPMIQEAAIKNENLSEHLMEATKCALGQITSALFEVGGQYRRNMLRAIFFEKRMCESLIRF